MDNSINEIEIMYEFYKKYDIIKLITPINFLDENKKFLKQYKEGNAYNPVYQYKNIDLGELNKYEEFFCNVDLEKLSFSKIYQDILCEIKQNINFIKNIGNSEKITRLSKSIFGYPKDDLVSKAKKILNDNNSVRLEYNKIYTSAYLKKIFQKRLKDYNFNWKIIITPQLSSSVAVDFDNDIIYINKNHNFSKQDIKRLQVHEIDTHVLRAENGKRQSDKIYKIGFPNFIETEEGFATYNEKRKNLLDINTFKVYAARVIGVDYALEHDFYSTFCYLSKYFSLEETLKIVSRIKRGIQNTANKGAFTKDYVYLNGYYLINENIDNIDLSLLYSGLVSYKYINDIKNKINLDNIIKPKPYIYE